MKYSNPDKPGAEQQISDTESNSHGANKTPNTSPSKIECQYQTQQPYYGWSLRRTTPYQRANIAVMILIFIVTGTYACFAYFQWNIMRSSMKLDQRAWIGIESMTGSGEIGKPTEVEIRFINTGKTPAKNVIHGSVVEPIEEYAPPDFAKEQYVLRETKGLRAPHQLFIVTHKLAEHEVLSDTQTLGLISGKIRLYVHGIVEYDDVFGDHHWMTYCSYLSKNGKSFTTYKEHNDTDDTKKN